MTKSALAVIAVAGLAFAGCGGTKTTTVTTTATAPSTASTVAESTTQSTQATTTSTQAAATLTVTKCSDKPYGSSAPVTVTSAAGISCANASTEQASYKWTGNNNFTTPGGYKCTSSGRGASGYQIRCVNGTKAYRIEFSD
jgi:hypothetical protein